MPTTPRGKIHHDQSGQLVNNIFFRIWTGPFFEDDYELPGVIVRGVPSGHPTEVSPYEDRSTDLSSRRCPHHPDFVDIRRYEYIHCLICNFGRDDGDAFGHHDFEFIHAGRRLQEALLGAGLNGTRFAETHVELDGPGPSHLKEIRTLCFDGRDMRRPFAVDPPEANRCFHCGFSPIVCPTCPSFESFCPSCSKAAWGGNLLSKDPRTVDTTLQSGFDDNGLGSVLDFDYWDGNDFVGQPLGSCIVTGRVVDLLLDLNVTNIALQPRRCHVGGRQSAEYAHLRSVLYQENLQHP
ncbi:hypothetical protein [Candidatus Laterigemmans baculatus]|uniref:hypothetical protein n=1 Tax=Candidatus Laterigemmans baculatus TaxID=2770505 RepID=UPI0013DA1AA4|nr:hypothetical protein [Candidatus Laterigemmans baculatus]